MKKYGLFIIAILLLGSTAGAQDYKTSLGLRAGYPYGVSVKHFLNQTNAVEGIVASSWGDLVITGLYENEHWTGQYPGLNWYWGFGAHIGFWSNNRYITDLNVGAVLGADFVLGLEYTFDDIPLNLALDIMPSVNLIGYTGWGGIHGGLSVRYVF